MALQVENDKSTTIAFHRCNYFFASYCACALLTYCLQIDISLQRLSCSYPRQKTVTGIFLFLQNSITSKDLFPFSYCKSLITKSNRIFFLIASLKTTLQFYLYYKYKNHILPNSIKSNFILKNNILTLCTIIDEF
jgi:hypothetical protein